MKKKIIKKNDDVIVQQQKKIKFLITDALHFYTFCFMDLPFYMPKSWRLD